RRARLGCECRSGTSGRNDYRYLPANQFGRQLRQPLVLTLSPAIFDRHVLALDIAGVLEALAECAHTVRKRVRRCTAEEPDHRHGRLLCARRERPRGCRAAEQRDEFAPLHVRHGDFLPYALSALPADPCARFSAARSATERPSSPWGRPESF